MLRIPILLAALTLAVTAVVPRPHAAAANVSQPAAATVASVLTYHNDYYRSGAYVVKGLTLARAANVHLDSAFDGKIDGNMYAQPLYWRTATGNGLVIVATESNRVTALDAKTGRVVWNRALGAPVTSGLPCGNVNPEGVTGTPVIDPVRKMLYVASTTAGSGGAVSEIYAISLSNGHVAPGWPVVVDTALKHLGFTAQWQGERGALAVMGNRLYIPYGGRYGDCDNYHGSVVAIDLDHPAVVAAWQTKAVRGGIWSVGGVMVADGSIFAATGNTSTDSSSPWSGGEALVRLTADFRTSTTPADYFAPSTWQTLDNDDLDLGGTNPTALDVDAAKFAVDLGKDGNVYLTNRLHLGGVGGELASAKFSNQQTTGGPASWVAGGVGYVAYATAGSDSKCSSAQGLTVAYVRGGAKPSIGTAWCASLNGAGSPIVTTSDGTHDRIVWATGAEGDNLLHGYNAANGAVVSTGRGQAIYNLRHMGTILIADGSFYIPSDNRIYRFIP